MAEQSAPNSSPSPATDHTGREAAEALGVLTCDTALTYLERISCRPGSLTAIRGRPWACNDAHAYWMRRLRAGGWLLSSSGRVQLDPCAVACVRAHLEALYGVPRAYLPRWRMQEAAGSSEPSAPALGEPRDLLLALAMPTRRSIYEALVREPQRIGRLASRLGYVHSLVSYHVKQLSSCGLISPGVSGRFEVDGRVVGAVLLYLAHLEIGWPYPARRGDERRPPPPACTEPSDGASRLTSRHVAAVRLNNPGSSRTLIEG